MSNPKTAQEWRAAAAELEKQRQQWVSNTAEIVQLSADNAKIIADYDAERAKVINLLATPNISAETRASLERTIKELDEKILSNQNKAAEFNANLEESKTKTNSLNEQYAAANKEAAKAESGPDQTSPNTPPANANPGPNTQITEIELPAPVNISAPPVENTGVVQTFAVPSPNVIATPTSVSDTKPQTTQNTRSIDQPAIAITGELKEMTNAERDALARIEVAEPTTSDNKFVFVGPTQPETLLVVSQPPLTDVQSIRAADEQIRAMSPAPKSDQEQTQYDAATAARLQELTNAENSSKNGKNQGNVAGQTSQARKSANQVFSSKSKAKDLRVRISLAPTAQYLYTIATEGDILYPLKNTEGVIFPYTPQISLSYSANYDSQDIVHSNYKIYNYKGSSVEAINIVGDFTAQDTYEANYLLAVMHFFKSVTKMFYGNDNNPPRGTPPPLCYLSGYGTYAFDNHPMVIQSFQLSYPNDVNYINAGANIIQGTQLTQYKKPTFPEQRGILARIAGLKSTGVAPGGISSKTPFSGLTNFSGITRVPTKMTITLTALPIMTRNSVSNNFSLRDYATGGLLKNIKGYGGTW